MNIIRLDSNQCLEFIVRLLLWLIFWYLNSAPPFHRHIAAEELWLYKYPYPGTSYVSSSNLWIIIFAFPVAVFAIEYIYEGKYDDIKKAFSSLMLAYGLNGSITNFIKIIVGRPRPDFYHRCFPDRVGDDVTKCTGTLLHVHEGRKSFPSGHASFAFTCMVFMSCYIAKKLSLWSVAYGQAWRLCATIFPLIIASSIAISRTIDYHHHYEDIICGGVLGTIIAVVTYRLYFPPKANQEKKMEYNSGTK